MSQLQCRSPLRTPRLPRILRTPCRGPCARLRSAAPRSHPLVCSRLHPAPLRQLPCACACSPNTLPRSAYRTPSAVSWPPTGRIAGPSAVSQRAPGCIVGGDARQACAQPAQLHITSYLYCSMISNLLHQNFIFFFMINIFFFINSSSMKNH